MRRVAATLFLCLALPLAAAGPKKAVPLDVSGDTVILVRSLPCKVTAAPGATVYLWNVPDGLTASADENVLTVTAGKEGSYTVSVVSLRIDFDRKAVTKDRGEVSLNIGKVVPPGPRPPDPPGPVPEGPLRVLIVYESSTLKDLPALQQSILGSVTFRRFLDSVCADDPQAGTRKAWWMLDKDADVSSLAKHWQDAMRRPRASVPFIHILRGDGVAHEGPLPGSIDETAALVKKYVVPAKGK